MKLWRADPRKIVSNPALELLLLAGWILTPMLPASTEVVVEGTLYCRTVEGSLLPAFYNCRGRGQDFAFETLNGQLFVFPANDPRAASFEDERIRRERLRVTGLAHSADRIEMLAVHAVREDGLYRLYYYCEVCHIRAFAPGPCWCCQDPFELREELDPVGQ